MSDSNNQQQSNVTTISDLMKYWPIILWCVTSIFALGGIFVKVDNIQKGMEKTETQFESINDRQTLTSQTIIELRGKADLTNQMTNQNGKEIAAINERLIAVERNSRFGHRQ